MGEETPPQEITRIHAVIHGRVQGVFFRAFTQQTAHQLDLKGWVRNRTDGTVEVLAVGVKSAIQEFEKALTKGPPGARVDRVIKSVALPTEEYSHFTIKPTK